MPNKGIQIERLIVTVQLGEGYFKPEHMVNTSPSFAEKILNMMGSHVYVKFWTSPTFAVKIAKLAVFICVAKKTNSHFENKTIILGLQSATMQKECLLINNS